MMFERYYYRYNHYLVNQTSIHRWINRPLNYGDIMIIENMYWKRLNFRSMI
ncbi:hypothetical protein BLA29_014850, partial [Euroglyphus maynei]